MDSFLQSEFSLYSLSIMPMIHRVSYLTRKNEINDGEEKNRCQTHLHIVEDT